MASSIPQHSAGARARSGLSEATDPQGDSHSHTPHTVYKRVFFPKHGNRTNAMYPNCTNCQKLDTTFHLLRIFESVFETNC